MKRDVAIKCQPAHNNNYSNTVTFCYQAIINVFNLSMQGADDLFGLEYGMYSTSGWLAGEMFVEAGANATLFTQPHGPCTLSITRYFGVCTIVHVVYNY